MRDIGARIERLKQQEKEARARTVGPAKKLGRPPTKDPFSPAERRRRRGAGLYHRTSHCIPLWCLEGLLEAVERGLAPTQSGIVTLALQEFYAKHGIGILVPVGPALPARPGEQPTRLYMPKKARK